jgi:hypothetical protein
MGRKSSSVLIIKPGRVLIALMALFLLTMLPYHANAGEQEPDLLILAGNVYEIGVYPLEGYYARYPEQRPAETGINSALERGYRATYELEGDRLLIVDLEIMESHGTWRSVFAQRFKERTQLTSYSGTINLFNGERTNVSIGFMPVYERYVMLEIERGICINSYTANAYEYLLHLMEVFKDVSSRYEYIAEALEELRGLGPEIYHRLNNEKYRNGAAELRLAGNDVTILVWGGDDDKDGDTMTGRVTGTLQRLVTPSRPLEKYSYAVIENYRETQSRRAESCIIVFIESDYGIEVIVYGDSPNLATGSYNGLYVRYDDLRVTNKDYRMLEKLFAGAYEPEKAVALLGGNTRYFLEVFAARTTEPTDDAIIIQGWEPGGNRYTNGIILIQGGYIYILFGDVRRQDNVEYHYYTDDPNADSIPETLRAWHHYPNDVKINRVK